MAGAVAVRRGGEIADRRVPLVDDVYIAAATLMDRARVRRRADAADATIRARVVCGQA